MFVTNEEDAFEPYVAEQKDMEEHEEEDTEQEVKRSGQYGKGEISLKKGMLIFAAVAVPMVALFVLNLFKVLPWWGTLAGSLLVFVIILIAYIMVRKKM